MNFEILLEKAITASLAGGEAIMQVYNTAFDVEYKDDKSPLTLADKNAHTKIVELLADTKIPVLSEEGKGIPYVIRNEWDYFWMVDPLDGTKEFVKRNGEFTVNIALIHKGQSIMGVIYVPVKKVLYFGLEGMGAYKKCDVVDKTPSLPTLINLSESLPIANNNRPYRVVGSRSHMSEETLKFVEKEKVEHENLEMVSMGSSLKICLVAEGVADVYPRFAPTMEWDTAAGNGIVTAAGKQVIDYSTGKPMRYNKENLLNNWFIVR